MAGGIVILVLMVLVLPSAIFAGGAAWSALLGMLLERSPRTDAQA